MSSTRTHAGDFDVEALYVALDAQWQAIGDLSSFYAMLAGIVKG